jgi:5-methyltetrahydropteroyltriglutamate--homocysteine methyltransferase
MSPSESSNVSSTVLGYPRIGPQREVKLALDAYFADRIDADQLSAAVRSERRRSLLHLATLGLDAVPINVSPMYDQMLDTAVMLGAVPHRYRAAYPHSDLDCSFVMARGDRDLAPLELTKWFDTNYHYVVPEIGTETRFALDTSSVLGQVAEADELGVVGRPVVIGPLTFLLLSKPVDGEVDPITRVDEVVELYVDLLVELADAGVEWVQLDEPAYVCDRSPAELALLERTYARLARVARRPKIAIATYFGGLGAALPAMVRTGVDGLAIDLVSTDPADLQTPGLDLRDRTIFAGVVDGRNVWRTDRDRALETLASVVEVAGRVVVSSSCSLLHVPYSLESETLLPPAVRARLAFADEKIAEVTDLARALRQNPGAAVDTIPTDASRGRTPASSGAVVNDEVRARIDRLGRDDFARSPYAERKVAQAAAIPLPDLPTTTIGSFPQTQHIRRARADHRAGRLEAGSYEATMRDEIARVVRDQERLGLDVIVHGEAERNDMVQYFSEQLDGFVTTEAGWVQSYGSRCVRPPILYGDVSRPKPMTVEWARFAQSLTSRPVKGMLTGPVTILAWSFVRADQPLHETATQVALAIRDEVADLEAAGVGIIQVDEPALRELLPLRSNDHPSYLAWAVDAFRLATAGVRDQTQIHTHLCYSEFGAVIEAIEALDADVTSIEAARSGMEIVADLARMRYPRGIGPGVYDIHSPRVPSVAEIEQLITLACRSLPPERVWVNPDCGLKTRGEEEVRETLANMVAATRRVRAMLVREALDSAGAEATRHKM